MPWCENAACSKKGLKKEDVEFDDERELVLCKECYDKRSEPGLIIAKGNQKVDMSQWPLSYGVHFTSEEGFKAEVKFGDLGLSFHAPPEEIQKIFGSDDGHNE
jgi:hypothetical protein